jgi:hypothetical protein
MFVQMPHVRFFQFGMIYGKDNPKRLKSKRAAPSRHVDRPKFFGAGYRQMASGLKKSRQTVAMWQQSEKNPGKPSPCGNGRIFFWANRLHAATV